MKSNVYLFFLFQFPQIPQKALGYEDHLIITYIQNQSNNWSIKTLELKHHDYEVVAKWKSKLDQIIDKVSTKRPKKLMVFINPFGGKGEAVEIHKNIVQPLFKQFKIETEIIITQRANHARDHLR